MYQNIYHRLRNYYLCHRIEINTELGLKIICFPHEENFITMSTGKLGCWILSDMFICYYDRIQSRCFLMHNEKHWCVSQCWWQRNMSWRSKQIYWKMNCQLINYILERWKKGWLSSLHKTCKYSSGYVDYEGF